jgi:hypothetical protein
VRNIVTHGTNHFHANSTSVHSEITPEGLPIRIGVRFYARKRPIQFLFIGMIVKVPIRQPCHLRNISYNSKSNAITEIPGSWVISQSLFTYFPQAVDPNFAFAQPLLKEARYISLAEREPD